MRSPNLLALVAAGIVVGAGIGQARGTVPGGLARTAVANEAAVPVTAPAADLAPRPTARPTLAPARAHPDTAPRRRGSTSRSSSSGRAAAVLRTSRAVLAAARVETGPQGLRVQRALARLGPRVNTSDRDALRMAFRAYYAYKAAHPEHVRKPYLYFVDYGLDAETPRGYVFDMRELRIVEGPFPVAHGRGSAPRGGVPRRFSNRHGSEATSLGLFVAQETYRFSGHANGRLYSSIGLRLRGVSGRFNARARERGVVVHGAPYVTREGAGRSEGCPAVSPARARTLIPRIRNGGLVFLYSPHDRTWKSEDPWANRGRG
ncbi:murein L,D-transpeptidase catalytic domain-containing protein [Longimicrobium sp.]|uniref:murein L,D-transpeptidase catalytic domain-containing protein n=1 Tax=Longimicrobium sp. TaxID=2029185 RepID=UPI002CE281AA|nr:murein L,D-transpeptidase catalytic domain family protein [Longimicrobium sp.]HSU13257.1 murein L,D-transpeptidase catalytic domain family protein [Longimicrobium sp.]